MRDYLLELVANIIYPDGRLVCGLFLLIFFDLLTGIRKSAKNHIATSSNGLRMTINKATTYFTFLSSVWIITNVAKPGVANEGLTSVALDNLLNFVLLVSMYIEFKSILENIIETSPDTDLVKYIIKPLHNVLILKIRLFEPKI